MEDYLFKTNDNVPMYLGSIYWYVNGNPGKLKVYAIKICSTHDISKGMVNFSTRELAEQWIADNVKIA